MAKRVEDDVEQTVESEWRGLCKQLSIKADQTAKWWKAINEHYSEPGRHYHTLVHLSHMLEQKRATSELLTNAHEVTLAVFFHDIIYDPKRADNEKQSGLLFLTFAEECLTDAGGVNPQAVFGMIMSTESHQTDAHNQAAYGCEDVHYLLDYDMYVLGGGDEDYNCYAGNIRQEYAHIPLSEYCQRRAKVLSTFLERKKIFCTKKFANCEAQARYNIEREISALDRGQIL